MKITDSPKESYINEKTIKKKFLGTPEVRKYEQIFAYIIVNIKDHEEALMTLVAIGMLIGRFEYKYEKEHENDEVKKKI